METFPRSPVAAVNATYSRRSSFSRINKNSMAMPTSFTAVFRKTIREYCSSPQKPGNIKSNCQQCHRQYHIIRPVFPGKADHKQPDNKACCGRCHTKHLDLPEKLTAHLYLVSVSCDLPLPIRSRSQSRQYGKILDYGIGITLYSCSICPQNAEIYGVVINGVISVITW